MASPYKATPRRPSILDRSLTKPRNDKVSLAAFSFLFCEMVQYTQKRVSDLGDLELQLNEFGYRMSHRILELVVWRDKLGRPKDVLSCLIFINSHVWKALFGKPADSLEKSTEHENECMLFDADMISDNDPLVGRFVSIPKEMSFFSCGAFVGGIVQGILDASGFPCKVTAHSTATAEFPTRTTLLMKFEHS